MISREVALEIAARVSDIQRLIKDAGTVVVVTIENDEPQSDGVYVEGLDNLMRIAVHKVDVESEYLGDNTEYKFRVTTRMLGIDFHTVCTEAELAKNGISSDA